MTIKVFQVATGNVGSEMIKRIADQPDLELIGVHCYSPDKVGRDAGEEPPHPPRHVAEGSEHAHAALLQRLLRIRHELRRIDLEDQRVERAPAVPAPGSGFADRPEQRSKRVEVAFDILARLCHRFVHSGILSCLRHGRSRLLVRSMASARAMRRRVECGMITSST